MFSAAATATTAANKACLLVTEGDTVPGFFGAYMAINSRKFERVVAAVKDKSGELVALLELLGVEIREYDPSKMDKALCEVFKGVDSMLLVPVHTVCKKKKRMGGKAQGGELELADDDDFAAEITAHLGEHDDDADAERKHGGMQDHMVKCTCHVIEAAEKSGNIKRMLLWSLMGAGPMPHGGGGDAGPSSPAAMDPLKKKMPGKCGDYKRIFHDFHAVEKMVRECCGKKAIKHECIFRVAFCDQLFFMLSAIIQSRGLMPLTSKSAKFAPVNMKDIAMASAMLLCDPAAFEKWHRQTLTLTGPDAYNGPMLVELVNKTIHTHIEFAEVSMREMCKILMKSMMHDPAMTMVDVTELRIMMGWMEMLRENKMDVMTPELKELLGRNPTSVVQFFEDNPDAFRPHRSCVEKCAAADAKRAGAAIFHVK